MFTISSKMDSQLCDAILNVVTVGCVCVGKRAGKLCLILCSVLTEFSQPSTSLLSTTSVVNEQPASLLLIVYRTALLSMLTDICTTHSYSPEIKNAWGPGYWSKCFNTGTNTLPLILVPKQ